MTSARWLDQYPNSTPDSPEDHPQLLAWAAEQAALDAPIPRCTCWDESLGEYTEHHPCDYCRSRDLAEIDIDGHDDKREPGETA